MNGTGDRAALWLAAAVLAGGSLPPLIQFCLVARDHSRSVAWLWRRPRTRPRAGGVSSKIGRALALFGGNNNRSGSKDFASGGSVCAAWRARSFGFRCSSAWRFFRSEQRPLSSQSGESTLLRSERSVVALQIGLVSAAAIRVSNPVVAARRILQAQFYALRVWCWNYHNHAGFYQQNVRTYWLWLVANPIRRLRARSPENRGLLGICAPAQDRLASTSGRTSLVPHGRLAVAVALGKKHGGSGPALADHHALARLAGTSRLRRGVFRTPRLESGRFSSRARPLCCWRSDDCLPRNRDAGRRVRWVWFLHDARVGVYDLPTVRPIVSRQPGQLFVVVLIQNRVDLARRKTRVQITFRPAMAWRYTCRS